MPLQNAMPDKPELGVLRADLSVKRRAGLARAKAVVKSDRYRQVVLKTALWLAGGHWSTTSDPMVVAHRERSVRQGTENASGRIGAAERYQRSLGAC